MFNNVYLSEARDFTKCSFHLVLLFSEFYVDCEQSLFCLKIRRENERDGMRDIRAASGEAVSRE